MRLVHMVRSETGPVADWSMCEHTGFYFICKTLSWFAPFALSGGWSSSLDTRGFLLSGSGESGESLITSDSWLSLSSNPFSLTVKTTTDPFVHVLTSKEIQTRPTSPSPASSSPPCLCCCFSLFCLPCPPSSSPSSCAPPPQEVCSCRRWCSPAPAGVCPCCRRASSPAFPTHSTWCGTVHPWQQHYYRK